nr:polyadenylate-binding protein RBP45C [Tanacetum cinerariifolium]
MGSFVQTEAGQVFVGSLDPNVTDDHLKQVFSQYGQLVHVKIHVGKRCGFVQFAERSCGEEALQSLQGTQLGGQIVRLSCGRNPSSKHSETNKHQARIYIIFVQPHVEQSQYNGAGYYGYGQGYETYGYAPVAQDLVTYYGGYPGYGGYPHSNSSHNRNLSSINKDDELQKLLKQMECSLAMALAKEDAWDIATSFWFIVPIQSPSINQVFSTNRGVKISPNSRVARLRPTAEKYMLGSLLLARQWHVHESEVVEVVADQYEDNTIDATHVDDSKVGLQRVLETRKAVLQREQAMVYARALVAGFETYDLARVFC